MSFQAFFLATTVFILTRTIQGEGDIRVCPGKILEIRCAVDEVIVISSAKFGRMEFTKCTVVEDFIGCENDVLFLMDRWCSGRSVCRVEVPNDDLIENNKACLPYLRKYLQVQYTCLKVIQHEDCPTAAALDNAEGVLSSHTTAKTGCGSPTTPWILSAMPGQTIQLSIVDFGSEALKAANKSSEMVLYGYIRDGQHRQAFYGSTERERILYKSKSNKVILEVVLTNADVGFLIQYRKLGCPDLTPPAHAWYKRDGDQAVIGCEWSQKTWHLSCDGHSWSGVVGNCSEPVTEGPAKMDKEVASPSALWLVCVISVSVVLMVIALVTGVVCIKKYRIKQDVQKSMTLQRIPGQGHYDLDPNIEMASMLYLPYKTSEQQQDTQLQQQQQQGTPIDSMQRPTSYLVPQDQVVNELTPIRIWERPLPELPEKPLASETLIQTTRSGRTPGDGDEAVRSVNAQESSTLRSDPSEAIIKASHDGHKYSALTGQLC